MLNNMINPMFLNVLISFIEFIVSYPQENDYQNTPNYQDDICIFIFVKHVPITKPPKVSFAKST